MTRSRCALLLLLALTWNVVGPWLGLERAPAAPAPAIASSDSALESGAALMPGAAVGERLARLAEYQSTLPPAVAAVVDLRSPPAPPRRGVPLRLVRPLHPRPHSMRAVDERDDPS